MKDNGASCTTTNKGGKGEYGFSFFVIIILVFFGILGYLICANVYSLKHSTIYTLELSEMAEGVYAYREQAVSHIPAQNYTMATFCDTNGNIYTVKGKVFSVNYTSGKPYAVWESTNIVNSDTVTIYAPVGSVVYNGAVTIR